MTKKIPRTLVLSWSVPPAGSGSGIIMGNIMRQFSRDEMVAVGAYGLNSPKLAWDSTKPQILYGMLQLPGDWRGEYLFRRIQFPFLLLLSLVVAMAWRCEVILAIFPDDLFLLVGYLLSRLLRKPLFAWFHNTYLDDVIYGSALAKWLQPRVFAHARHTFVSNEAMQGFYREKYPDLPCSTLNHTFSEPLPDPQEVCVPPLHEPLRLAFIGNLNDSCAEAAARMFHLVQRHPDYALQVYSGAMNEVWLTRLGYSGTNISVESVSRDVLLGRMQESDIFIHPHGFTGPRSAVEYQTIFPTRTVEYLLGQRPILAHLPGNCSLARFYREHECALIVDEPTVEALEEGIRRLASDACLRETLVRNALKAAQRFQAAHVADHLREVVGS